MPEASRPKIGRVVIMGRSSRLRCTDHGGVDNFALKQDAGAHFVN
ncbi:hypothetical protein LF41_1303 [Lysobacter dokdonensis DS-58]|uniref:Uncharacterized protein n=1 Tax=Lysobacter dokdonensis DS-58 TaxID=1300345 RepID=A0A0A2WLS8_9GAMM|nr:hypothetical protein LF41_1303 [Lysobacter dokdonensis DS-58]